jgi:hypothetical protein
MDETVNTLLDTLSLGMVGVVFAKILPPLALVLTIVWSSIRIYEWVRHRFIVRDPTQFK